MSKPSKSQAPYKFVTIDSVDEEGCCYYTCPHCGVRSHSEYDKWWSMNDDNPNMPSYMICPKCGLECSHPYDFED